MSFENNPYYKEFQILFEGINEQVEYLLEENKRLNNELKHLNGIRPEQTGSGTLSNDISETERIAIRRQIAEYIHRIDNHLGEES